MSDTENEPATIASLMASENPVSAKEDGFFLSNDAEESKLKPLAGKSSNVAIESCLREANMLVPGSQLGQNFSDEYRRIKRPLLANAFGKTSALVEHGNLMLVTSTVPGEGKTHTAANLALSIAQEKDHTVLLVDCDVNKQGISRLLRVFQIHVYHCILMSHR